MKAICGANCNECERYKNKTCRGCIETNGCPFGEKCWIANYIELGGIESFEEFQKELIKEINELNILGMPKINKLYCLNGGYINLEYNLPNGKLIKFLNDDEAYLGTQVEYEIEGNQKDRCIGIVANMNFILVCDYEENGKNPEILVYKKR